MRRSTAPEPAVEAAPAVDLLEALRATVEAAKNAQSAKTPEAGGQGKDGLHREGGSREAVGGAAPRRTPVGAPYASPST